MKFAFPAYCSPMAWCRYGRETSVQVVVPSTCASHLHTTFADLDQHTLSGAHPLCRGQEQQHTDQPSSSRNATVTASNNVQQIYSYSTLLHQLDAIGWSRVAELSPDLGKVTLQLTDAAGRQHLAVVDLGLGSTAAAPAVYVDLPKPWKPKWLPGHTLAHLIAQLEQVLESYQTVWHQLEDVDTNTQIQDPPQALANPYNCCSRCIALGNGCSCQIQLSAAVPTALPGVTFHGPSSNVAALQNLWYSCAHQIWDQQQSVRQNLEAVLQVSLPPPKPGVHKGCAAAAAIRRGTVNNMEQVASGDTKDDEDMNGMDDGSNAGACAVCYSVHLPNPARPKQIGAAPSVSCPGQSCGRVYHAACLAEWLGTLPETRRVFDTLFGSCPFCNSPIGVSTRAAAANA